MNYSFIVHVSTGIDNSEMTSWCHEHIVDKWGWDQEKIAYVFFFKKDANKFKDRWL